MSVVHKGDRPRTRQSLPLNGRFNLPDFSGLTTAGRRAVMRVADLTFEDEDDSLGKVQVNIL